MGTFVEDASAQGAWKLKLAFVWGGELVSVLTSSVLQMGLIWHITLTTNSASMLSLASLAGFLPLALFGMFAGTIVDRFPLRRSLIGADLFIAAVSLAVAVAAAMGALPIWMVIVALFLRAIGSAFHTPAFQALTPLLAPPEHLTRLAGVAQAVQSGGYILGTALAAVIYPLFGLVPMVALDVVGALFAAGAVLAANIRAGGRARRTARMPPAATCAPCSPRPATATGCCAATAACSPCSGAASRSPSCSRPFRRSFRS
mgnify:CR=1 FL=1